MPVFAHPGLGRVCCRATLALLAAGSLASAQPPDGARADEASAAAETPAPVPPAPPVTTPPDDPELKDPEQKESAGRAEVTIDLRPTAILEGHDLRATIKVQPDSGNRLLAVVIDAPTFYASTERELMGAASPRTYTFKWEKLPAGRYRVEAVVTDAAGRLTRVNRDFQVHGGTLDGEMEPTRPSPGRRGRRR